MSPLFHSKGPVEFTPAGSPKKADTSSTFSPGWRPKYKFLQIKLVSSLLINHYELHIQNYNITMFIFNTPKIPMVNFNHHLNPECTGAICVASKERGVWTCSQFFLAFVFGFSFQEIHLELFSMKCGQQVVGEDLFQWGGGVSAGKTMDGTVLNLKQPFRTDGENQAVSKVSRHHLSLPVLLCVGAAIIVFNRAELTLRTKCIEWQPRQKQWQVLFSLTPPRKPLTRACPPLTYSFKR